MKKILFILSLIFISIPTIKSQVGKYCEDSVFTKSCYEFEEGNRFKFIESMCVAIVEGQGSFEIKDDTIRFFYELMPFFEEQLSIKKTKKAHDKIEIKLSVKDYDTGKELKEYRAYQLHKGQFGDKISHPKNRINVKYVGSPMLIDISYPGYSSYTLKITDGGKYKVNLFLKYDRERDIYDMKEGIEKFIIVALTKDTIVLKHEEGDYEMVLIKEK